MQSVDVHAPGLPGRDRPSCGSVLAAVVGHRSAPRDFIRPLYWTTIIATTTVGTTLADLRIAPSESATLGFRALLLTPCSAP